MNKKERKKDSQSADLLADTLQGLWIYGADPVVEAVVRRTDFYEVTKAEYLENEMSEIFFSCYSIMVLMGNCLIQVTKECYKKISQLAADGQ